MGFVEGVRIDKKRLRCKDYWIGKWLGMVWGMERVGMEVGVGRVKEKDGRESVKGKGVRMERGAGKGWNVKWRGREGYGWQSE